MSYSGQRGRQQSHGGQRPRLAHPPPARATAAPGPPPPPWRATVAQAPPPRTTEASSTSPMPDAIAPSAGISTPPRESGTPPHDVPRYSQHEQDPSQETRPFQPKPPSSTPPWLQERVPAVPVDHAREWANRPAPKGKQKPKPIGDRGPWDKREPWHKKTVNNFRKRAPVCDKGSPGYT